MTDPTPEEIAACGIAQYIEEAWLQVSHLTSKGRLAFIEVAASRFTHAAVAAETERCAKVAELHQDRRVIPLAGEPIEETVAFMQRCIAAAIRKGPDAELADD